MAMRAISNLLTNYSAACTPLMTSLWMLVPCICWIAKPCTRWRATDTVDPVDAPVDTSVNASDAAVDASDFVNFIDGAESGVGGKSGVGGADAQRSRVAAFERDAAQAALKLLSEAVKSVEVAAMLSGVRVAKGPSGAALCPGVMRALLATVHAPCSVDARRAALKLLLVLVEHVEPGKVVVEGGAVLLASFLFRLPLPKTLQDPAALAVRICSPFLKFVAQKLGLGHTFLFY